MLRAFDTRTDSKTFEDHLILLMLESLHRRVAYLRGLHIVSIIDAAKAEGVKSNVKLNQAKRQTIPAFRERGIWKIGLSSV
jgi:hypothetical protein